MGVTEDLADALARDTIRAIRDLGDETMVDEVSRLLGASSQTLQEAYMTSVRVRLAEARGRDYLERRMAEGAASPAAPATGTPSGPADGGR